jgi:hypothetical protein
MSRARTAGSKVVVGEDLGRRRPRVVVVAAAGKKISGGHPRGRGRGRRVPPGPGGGKGSPPLGGPRGQRGRGPPEEREARRAPRTARRDGREGVRGGGPRRRTRRQGRAGVVRTCRGARGWRLRLDEAPTTREWRRQDEAGRTAPWRRRHTPFRCQRARRRAAREDQPARCGQDHRLEEGREHRGKRAETGRRRTEEVDPLATMKTEIEDRPEEGPLAK